MASLMQQRFPNLESDVSPCQRDRESFASQEHEDTVAVLQGQREPCCCLNIPERLT
jgi:hypothetical protein